MGRMVSLLDCRLLVACASPETTAPARGLFAKLALFQ